MFFKSLHNPNIAVLTPGIYNAAYFEHSFLADEIDVNLLNWKDLIIENNKVVIKTTKERKMLISFIGE